MQGPDYVEDPVLVIQSIDKRYMDYATISQHHIFIKGPRTNIRSWAGLALQFILCVHTFCSLEEFTITALVESQHTSSSYTIDNSPSYSAFRLRKPLGRRACRILQLSDNEKSVKFKFAKDEMQIPDLFCGPSWQGLGLWSFTSSSSSEQVRDRFHVQQRHNRYLGEHQWGKKVKWIQL